MIDLQKKALGRLIFQYRNSPKMLAWVSMLPSIGQKEISDACQEMLGMLDVDSVSGEQLDIVGRIAGFDARPRVLGEGYGAFGYAGTPGAEKYGDAPYRSGDPMEGYVSAPDYIFRVMVKSKIAKNNSNATIDEIKRSVDYIVGGNSYVVDGQDMTIGTVYVDEGVSSTILQLLLEEDLIPRPQGVKIAQVSRFQTGLGYSGTIGAQPYGQAPYRSAM